ncbi:MAG: energy-coupling factor transporter transmembrane component T [Sphaerochaetaceae bacterium]|nr:energy-coupling factor transporter transmembrane component T [Sphaerochaetaceae bacterium]
MVEGVVFHFRDRNTFLNQANPLTKLVSLLCCSVLLVGANLPRTLAMGGLLLLVALSLRLPFRRYLRETLFFLFMAAFIAVTEWWATKSPEATAATSLRFLAIVLAGMLLADTTAPDDLSRALGALMDKIPFLNGYKLAAGIELTLAIIPLIFDVATELRMARQARQDRPWRHPVAYLVSYCSTMFSLLMDRMDDLSVALDARGYDPSAPRKAPGFTYRDVALSLTTGGLAALCALVI